MPPFYIPIFPLSRLERGIKGVRRQREYDMIPLGGPSYLMHKIGILTVSDGVAQGVRKDLSGQVIQDIMTQSGFQVAKRAVVPDEVERIAEVLRNWADKEKLALVLTTGGTGVGPRDVTPEATLSVVERVVPGLAEVMRAESLKKTPMGMLSRQVAGIRGRCLIINLPGSPKGVRECLEAVMSAIPHALGLLSGEITLHTPNQ